MNCKQTTGKCEKQAKSEGGSAIPVRCTAKLRTNRKTKTPYYLLEGKSELPDTIISALKESRFLACVYNCETNTWAIGTSDFYGHGHLTGVKDITGRLVHEQTNINCYLLPTGEIIAYDYLEDVEAISKTIDKSEDYTWKMLERVQKKLEYNVPTVKGNKIEVTFHNRKAMWKVLDGLRVTAECAPYIVTAVSCLFSL